MDLSHYERCKPDELTDAIEQLHGLEAAARAQLLALVRVYDRHELWRQDGAHSMAAWLCQHLGLALTTAREVVDVAHALESLPALARVYDQGRLSWDQLRFAVRIATKDSDEAIAKEAPGLSGAQLEAAARTRRVVSSKETEEAHRRRFVRWRWDEPQTSLRLSGRLSAEHGAVITKARGRIAERAPRLDDGTYEPFESRVADALVEVCGAVIAKDADPDRATIVVHVDADALGDRDGSAQVENGGTLSAETARRLTCDARLQVLAHDRAGRPLGAGRTTRNISARLARELRRRDKTCRFPGCERTRLLHAHHIRHWVKHGHTEPDNLVSLCRFHHRLVHEGAWDVRGHPDEDLAFVRPDGTVLANGPPRLRQEIRARVVV